MWWTSLHNLTIASFLHLWRNHTLCILRTYCIPTYCIIYFWPNRYILMWVHTWAAPWNQTCLATIVIYEVLAELLPQFQRYQSKILFFLCLEGGSYLPISVISCLSSFYFKWHKLTAFCATRESSCWFYAEGVVGKKKKNVLYLISRFCVLLEPLKTNADRKSIHHFV